MLVEVTMLDGNVLPIEISSKATGVELLDAVAGQETVNLMEKDYFGMKYWDKKENTFLWVQNDRRLTKQLKEPMKVDFQVKFYPPDPSQLHEDLTRYLLCLQIQQDVKSGKLPCSFVTHALLGAYLVQSELGDYEPVDHGLSVDYIRDFDFAPNQSEDLLQRIMDVHKTLKGQTPAEAELHYLDNAKKLAMYGVTLQPARDSEGVDIMLGVCSSGILVYRDRLRINRFAWPKIIKISYKRNGFYIKIRPGEFEHFESTVGFKLENHKAAKRLWKICVEHHSFFRLLSPDKQEKPKFPRFGSRFRYSGRTQAQAKKQFATLERTNMAFERSGSHGRGGGVASHNNTLSSQSMQGISPARHNRSPALDDKTKRHTLGHNLPDQVEQELQDAQRERMAKSYDPSGFKDEKPLVPQPGSQAAQQNGHHSPPTTPGGHAKHLTNGHGGHSMETPGAMPGYSPATTPSAPAAGYKTATGPGGGYSPAPGGPLPAYSPAYPQRDGPQSTTYGSRTAPPPPGKPYHTGPTHETTFDADNSAPQTVTSPGAGGGPAPVNYVESAGRHGLAPLAGSGGAGGLDDDGAVDIDEMLGGGEEEEEEDEGQGGLGGQGVQGGLGGHGGQGVQGVQGGLGGHGGQGVQGGLGGQVGQDDNKEDYQFSRTDRLTRTEDGHLSQHTEQTIANLKSGEQDVQEFSLAGTASGADRVQAESVTTRTGRIHQDKTTGEQTAVLESRTLQTSQTHSTEPGDSTGMVTASITTSRKESSMSVRKESVISSSSNSRTVQELLSSGSGVGASVGAGAVGTEAGAGGGTGAGAGSGAGAGDIAEETSNQLDIDEALQSADVTKDEYAAEGIVVSSQTITSRSRTVETTTYAIEQEGQTETHIEQKVTIQSDGDPIDHDEALAQAIQEATAMNPDFTVEKIEISQTTNSQEAATGDQANQDEMDGAAEV